MASVRRAIAGLCCLLAACATGRQINGFATHEERWLELSSPHFTVDTDLGETEAREQVARLERALLVLAKAPVPISPLPAFRVRVVLMAEPEALQKLLGSRAAGVATVALGGEPLLIASVADVEAQDEIINHELEHVLQALVVPRAPRWLKEGLADYAGTFVFEDGAHGPVAAFGAPSPGRAFSWRDGTDLAPYLRDDWSAIDEEDARRAYAVGWLTVDYLIDRGGPELFDWLHQLGPVGGKVPSLFEALPGLTLDSLREALEQHLRRRTYKKLLFASPAWTGPVSLRKLAPAEALALLSELVMAGPQQTPAQAEQLAQALALQAVQLDPLEPAAMIMAEPYQPVGGRAERAKACAAAHPADWRCPALAGSAKDGSSADKLKSWERAARLGPEVPFALASLARQLTEARQYDRAASVALLALRAAPANPAYLGVLAFARAGPGRGEEAREVGARAISIASLHRRGRPKSEGKDLFADCVPASPPAAAP
jgi:hypothetical protein